MTKIIKSLIPVAVVMFLSATVHARGTLEYLHDDGTSDDAIGTATGGEHVWIHRFDTVPDFNTIVSISTTFGWAGSPGLSGVIGGVSTFEVWLWSDDDNDGDPSSGTTLLATASATADAGSIDTDVFQIVAITPTLVTTDQFFIGASVVVTGGSFPRPLDTSRAGGIDAWFTTDVTDFDGSDPLGGGPSGLGMSQADAVVPGVWLLRANAIPAPGAIGLLAVAALAGVRRRR